MVTVSDYEPFGSALENRTWSRNAEKYRYGFNGKETSDEIAFGDYDFGARIYSAPLGRWLSVDPLAGKYAGMSPYNGLNNNPILIIDPDGRGGIVSIKGIGKSQQIHVKMDLYFYAPVNSTIDVQTLMTQYTTEITNQFAGKQGRISGSSELYPIVFDFNPVNLGSFGQAEAFYNAQTDNGRKSLPTESNFILLHDDPNVTSVSFSNFSAIDINAQQPFDFSHEICHLLGYLTKRPRLPADPPSPDDTAWDTHPDLSVPTTSVMGSDPNRTVEQGDVDKLNFGYGLANTASVKDASRDRNQIKGQFVNRAIPVGNSMAKGIRLPGYADCMQEEITKGDN